MLNGAGISFWLSQSCTDLQNCIDATSCWSSHSLSNVLPIIAMSIFSSSSITSIVYAKMRISAAVGELACAMHGKSDPTSVEREISKRCSSAVRNVEYFIAMTIHSGDWPGSSARLLPVPPPPRLSMRPCMPSMRRVIAASVAASCIAVSSRKRSANGSTTASSVFMFWNRMCSDAANPSSTMASSSRYCATSSTILTTMRTSGVMLREASVSRRSCRPQSSRVETARKGSAYSPLKSWSAVSLVSSRPHKPGW
mmetsp:Transcript_65013/g.145199  ORF Transcript_65013/g.145199 Transcript_65013/m.145199 type:complete len:254 (-) Transcript_65013:1241-2002(-)